MKKWFYVEIEPDEVFKYEIEAETQEEAEKTAIELFEYDVSNFDVDYQIKDIEEIKGDE